MNIDFSNIWNNMIYIYTWKNLCLFRWTILFIIIVLFIFFASITIMIMLVMFDFFLKYKCIWTYLIMILIKRLKNIFDRFWHFHFQIKDYHSRSNISIRLHMTQVSFKNPNAFNNASWICTGSPIHIYASFIKIIT